MISFKNRQRLIRAAITIGVVTTFFLSVYPDPIVKLLDITDKSTFDLYTRLFTGLNAILLTFLGFAASRQLVPNRVPKLTIGRSLPRLAGGAQEPYRSIIISQQLPSFPDQSSVLNHITSAVVLANYKPVHVNDYGDLGKELMHSSVVGVIADSALSDEILGRTTGSGVSLYTIEPGNLFSYARIGNRVTIRIGNDLEELSNIYKTALPLAHAHAPDVIRSAGFHGTWATTYGLLSIREDRKGNASGVYWYGSGEIKGKIAIGEDHSSIILRYDWSQESNSSRIGSKSQGRGVFVIAPGYEVFFGYWYVLGNPSSTQLWSGTRLSRDVVTALTSNGPFSKDFGLSQHSLSNIADTGVVSI